MSLGAKLISSLITSDSGVEFFTKHNLNEILFKGGEVDLFKFVYTYLRSYGELPNESILNENGFQLVSTDAPPKYYLDDVKARHIHMLLKQAFLNGGAYLNDQDPYEALKVVKQVLVDATQTEASNKLIDYATEGYKLVLGEYKRKALNLDDYGVSLGWPTLDNEIGGLMPGDVLSFVGRPAMGKTYNLLYCALHAWRSGLTPMFVSMEMSPLLILQRLVAMHASVSVTQLKRATLSTASLTKVTHAVTSNTVDHPLWVLDGSLTAMVQDIELLANQLNPNIIFIDGAYLLRHPNNKVNKFDRIADNIESLKRSVAESLGIPVVLSYQFNRAAQVKINKQNVDQVGLEDIGGSDSIGQISSIVLGLLQEDTIETVKERDISILKGRSGESGKFTINWNFDDGPNFMDFTEVDTFDTSMYHV